MSRKKSDFPNSHTPHSEKNKQNFIKPLLPQPISIEFKTVDLDNEFNYIDIYSYP